MRRLLVLLTLLLAAFASAQTPPTKLRAGDEISVVVVGYVNYSGDYTVLDDGAVVGVGFGRVQAAGKTVGELRGEITKLLKKRFKDPAVEVVLKKQAVQLVYVVGGVKQDPIEYTNTLDLRQAIAMAGLMEPADLLDCIVSRPGEPVRKINLPKLLRGDAEEWNGPLLPNDVVTLMSRTFKVTVSGEVVQPGQYSVENDTQVGAAIAMARGSTKEGTLQNVLVFRGTDVFQIDASSVQQGKAPGFKLQPGDSVFVRKSENVVYALGEVKTPGRYVVPDNKEYRASDLLAAASGLGPNGSLRRVTLVRPDKEGKFVATRFNLDEFLKDGKMASNPTLQTGDILMFSPPKAVQILSLNQIASTAFLLNGIFKR